MHLFACTRRTAAIAAALFAGALAACAPAPATQDTKRSLAASRPAPLQIFLESRFVMLPRNALATLAAKLPTIKLPPEDGFSADSLLDKRDLSLFLRAISAMPDATSVSLPRKTLFDGATVSIPVSEHAQNYIIGFSGPSPPSRSDIFDTGLTATLSPKVTRDRRFINLRFSIAATRPSKVGTLAPNSPKEIHGTLAIPDGECAAISGFSIIDSKGKVCTSVTLVRPQIAPPRPITATTRPGQ